MVCTQRLFFQTHTVKLKSLPSLTNAKPCIWLSFYPVLEEEQCLEREVPLCLTCFCIWWMNRWKWEILADISGFKTSRIWKHSDWNGSVPLLRIDLVLVGFSWSESISGRCFVHTKEGTLPKSFPASPSLLRSSLLRSVRWVGSAALKEDRQKNLSEPD